MNTVDLIRRKRDGAELSEGQINDLMQGYTRGEIPDYQMSAFLMAVVWRGMTPRETVSLTLAMLRSGTELRVRDRINPVADKHSTGGVGDKVTLAAAPLLAACGLPVAKMTGRGLGHTGGTVDKLESISGLRTELTPQEFVQLLVRHGIVLAAQSADLAPADGKLYALRDVTSTIDSIPLIAASIMSKKLAVGPSHLLLDVKCGSGAFMKHPADARTLATTMTRIGMDAGVTTVAVLSSMEQPLGRAIGNALEVAEAIAILRGSGPTDVTELCLHEVAELLLMAGLAGDISAAHQRAKHAMRDGSGLERFIQIVRAQGGDPRQIEHPELLPQAPIHVAVNAPRSGYVSTIDTEQIGLAAVLLGAGRLRKGDAIDHAVGLTMHVRIGDSVSAGQPLVTVHARHEAQISQIEDRLISACSISDAPPPLVPLLIGTVSDPGRELPSGSAGGGGRE